MSDKPTLAYWKIRGFACGMQYLFKHLGVDYNWKTYEQTVNPDGTISVANWTDEKFKLGLDFPNIPYIIDGDFKVSESNACYEYICAKWKPEYLGKDPEERGRLAMIFGVWMNLRNGVVFKCYSGSIDRSPNLECIDKFLPGIYKFLGNNKFIIGNNVVWLDFAFYELINLMVFLKPDLFDVYPNLK